MKTKINLSKYEFMYDTFDKGHDRNHMEGVRKFAVKLAEKYCPEKIEIIYLAATLHDVGLSVSREQHEQHGYEIVKGDKEIKKAYSKEDFELILEAIKEHRASVGNPQSIVAKIVSDADKAYGDMYINFKRAYEYHLEKTPGLSKYEIMDEGARHLTEKFGEGGTGTRVYFEESRRRIIGTYSPIIEAYKKKDYKRMEKILDHSC